jgi:ribosomal protein S18 acetylase RimI-like enzyme
VQVRELDDEGWPWFLDQIAGQELDYYWFIVDWTNWREHSRIWVAEDHGALQGAMLVFKGRVCQLRGVPSAGKELLRHLGDDATEAVLSIECKDILPERFKVRRTEDIYLMQLGRGKENLVQAFDTVRLGIDDIDEVRDLMRAADPVTWGEITSEGLKDWITTGVWYGIRKEEKLAAVAGTWFKGDAIIVNIVAVAEPFRNKGMGRTVLSRLLKDIFQRTDLALIHVRVENGPAIRAYTATGFVPHKTYRRIIFDR